MRRKVPWIADLSQPVLQRSLRAALRRDVDHLCGEHLLGQRGHALRIAILADVDKPRAELEVSAAEIAERSQPVTIRFRSAHVGHHSLGVSRFPREQEPSDHIDLVGGPPDVHCAAHVASPRRPFGSTSCRGVRTRRRNTRPPSFVDLALSPLFSKTQTPPFARAPKARAPHPRLVAREASCHPQTERRLGTTVGPGRLAAHWAASRLDRKAPGIAHDMTILATAHTHGGDLGWGIALILIGALHLAFRGFYARRSAAIESARQETAPGLLRGRAFYVTGSHAKHGLGRRQLGGFPSRRNRPRGDERLTLWK